MLLFTLLFGRLARMPSDNIPYPMFAYAGLLPWTFFANAVTNRQHPVGSTSLITKVSPRMFSAAEWRRPAGLRPRVLLLIP